MDIILRATVMFFLMYLLLRLLGKEELSQVTPFELVMMIMVGGSSSRASQSLLRSEPHPKPNLADEKRYGGFSTE